ncbi:1-acyl-sn-glycerol-3-phosphate acyltransferase [soil metagenome]
MTEVPQKDFINIEEIIRGKNPRLLNFIPGFLIRYIKRIVHQDEVNDFIRRHGDKTSYAFVDEIIKEYGPIVTVEGMENIPATGGAIIASNHPLGGLDGMALVQVLSTKRHDQKFIVNDVLLNIKNLNDIFVGVNKHGKNSNQALDLIDSYYSGQGLVLIFPAGLVSRMQHGTNIRDLEWKKSFVTKSKKFNTVIIPVHIAGRNSNFFYKLGRWRQKFGIKANIEMFYLMDEMYHQMGKNIHIKIGKPLFPKDLDSKFTDFQWAQQIKEHIYNLGGGDRNYPFEKSVAAGLKQTK